MVKSKSSKPKAGIKEPAQMKTVKVKVDKKVDAKTDKNTSIPKSSNEKKSTTLANEQKPTNVSNEQKPDNSGKNKPSESKTSDAAKKDDKKKSVVQKAGDTDLRRGMNKLGELLEKNGCDPNNGDLYAFSNEKDKVKIIQNTPECSKMLVVKNKNLPSWPEYKKPGEPGHMIKINGNDIDKFFTDIGCPNGI
jgi:hypothetical protein